MKHLRIGSRASRLAIVQVQEFQQRLKQEGLELSCEHKTYQSAGDKDKESSLTSNVGDDFFTDTLDQALLSNEIDLTIHSAKDLPKQMHKDLDIFALTPSIDDTDAFVGRADIHELPAGSKIGTSSLLRQQGIEAINPDFTIVDIRGTIEERIKLVDEGKVDGIIVATIALKRLGLTDRIRNIMPWEGFPLQGQLAMVGRRSDANLRELFKPIDIRQTYGQVVLVGAGPGDPELITLKGIKALAEADCVLYDYLVHKKVLEHAPQAEKIYVGKRKGIHTLKQSVLSKLIRDRARTGKKVVRLKGGDPLIFGRGADEIEYLQSFLIDVAVIPGVSSATAIPSRLGIPLTARGYSTSVAFVSAHQGEEFEDDQSLLDIPAVGTIVFLMGLTKLSTIIKSLLNAKWEACTPVAVISKGTRQDEAIVVGCLDDILDKVRWADLKPPALIIVGKTVHFYNQKYYSRRTVLYTGTNPDKCRQLGNIIHLPMIRISEATLDRAVLDQLEQSIDQYHMVILTSRYGVRYFLNQVRNVEKIWLRLQKVDMIVIGKDTADALREYDIEPTHIASVETSQGVLQLLKEEYPLKGQKILFPRSNLPNPFLKNELTRLGAQVDQLTVYQNVATTKVDLPKDPIDQIVFTSPSTVKSFLDKYQHIPQEWTIISKGVVTQKALHDKGYPSEVLMYG